MLVTLQLATTPYPIFYACFCVVQYAFPRVSGESSCAWEVYGDNPFPGTTARKSFWWPAATWGLVMAATLAMGGVICRQQAHGLIISLLMISRICPSCPTSAMVAQNIDFAGAAFCSIVLQGPVRAAEAKILHAEELRRLLTPFSCLTALMPPAAAICRPLIPVP